MTIEKIIDAGNRPKGAIERDDRPKKCPKKPAKRVSEAGRSPRDRDTYKESLKRVNFERRE